jgi:hypothetical protein
MGDTKLPHDIAPVVQLEIDAWIADLAVLSRRSPVKQFVELRARLFSGDSEIVAPLGDGGILEGPKGLPVLRNELSAFKVDDLRDVVVPAPQVPSDVW